MKTGDRVRLIAPARVDRYWYDPTYLPRGSYDSHYMLPGNTGTVICTAPYVRARGTYLVVDLDTVPPTRVHINKKEARLVT